MSRLPALRWELESFPSPSREQPGLVLRDPLRYSEVVLLVPPALVRTLGLFDGTHDMDALEAALASLGFPKNERRPGAQNLSRSLSEAGFLEDENFEALRDQAHRVFADAPVRPPAHAGSGYPEESSALATTFDEYHRRRPPSPGTRARRPTAIVAPHVSPFGGVEAYAAAYQGLASDLAERTFVVLGTSHQGAPERFGLTKKSFTTPFGPTRSRPEIVDQLHRAARRAVTLEDYQHAVEHTIEFQIVFLQHALGRPDLHVVPVLCGPFLKSLVSGRAPEEDADVRAFIDALSDLRAKRDDLVFVLGVDLAHVGRRYGDPMDVHRGRGRMLEIEAEERARLRALFAGEHETFLELVTRDTDPLRWCGFSPLHTFLRAAPEARGTLLHYDQWNIDEGSVVSFVAAEYAPVG